MTKAWVIAAATILALELASTAQAGGDATAGEAKAKSCAGCHGADGKGNASNPPIAGMDEAAFVAAMGDYESGARKHAMMKILAKKLNDQDIANLAAYYASLK